MTTIIGIIILGLLILELKLNKEKFTIAKQMYFTSWKNWVVALLTVIFVIGTVVTTQEMVPDFLNWGWTNLVYDDTTNINIGAPIEVIKEAPEIGGFQLKYIGMLGFYMMLVLLLPTFAKYEEVMFRHKTHKWFKIIWKSLLFGFVHMIVGISVYIALVLAVVGFIYQMIYRYEFNNYVTKGYSKESAEDKALIKSSSVHTIYNFILVSMMAFTYILAFYYGVNI